MKVKDINNCPHAIPSSIDSRTFKSLSMNCDISGFPCSFVSVEGCRNTIDIIEEDKDEIID